MKKLSFLIFALFFVFQNTANATVCYSISNTDNTLTISVTPDADYNTAPNNRWVTGNVTLSWDVALGNSVVESWAGLNGFTFAPDGPVRTSGSTNYQKFGFTFDDPLVFDMTNGTSVDVLEIVVSHPTETEGDFAIAETTPAADVHNGNAAFANVFADEFLSAGCALSVTAVPLTDCVPQQVQNIFGFVYNQTKAFIGWTPSPQTYKIRIRYREVGMPWQPVITVGGLPRVSHVLVGLSPNTTYEYKLQEMCPGGVFGAFSPTYTFTTYSADPCSVPDYSGYAYILNNNPTKMRVFCSYEPEADGNFYTVRYRELGVPTWTNLTIRKPNTILTNLSTNTQYEYQWRTKCAGGWTGFNAVDTFLTLPPLPVAPRDDWDDFDTEAYPSALSLFPNPTAHEIWVDMDADELPAVLRIFNAQGALVSEKMPTEYVERFDVSGLPSGTYSVQGLWGGSEVVVERFVKM